MIFEETPEYIQSINMQPACNKVLSDVFDVNIDSIKRFNKKDDKFILDQEFHIDIILTLKNGSTLTGQEKSLSNKFYKFKTFTMEFYQNRYTKQKGEFFKIASQFYLHGYSDESGTEFKEWYIFDVIKILLWLKSYNISELEKITRPSTSNASFLYISYSSIPKEFIIQSYIK
jgi:hypothetical protein